MLRTRPQGIVWSPDGAWKAFVQIRRWPWKKTSDINGDLQTTHWHRKVAEKEPVNVKSRHGIGRCRWRRRPDPVLLGHGWSGCKHSISFSLNCNSFNHQHSPRGNRPSPVWWPPDWHIRRTVHIRCLKLFSMSAKTVRHPLATWPYKKYIYKVAWRLSD